jgi:hypothetical protein
MTMLLLGSANLIHPGLCPNGSSNTASRYRHLVKAHVQACAGSVGREWRPQQQHHAPLASRSEEHHPPQWGREGLPLRSWSRNAKVPPSSCPTKSSSNKIFLMALEDERMNALVPVVAAMVDAAVLVSLAAVIWREIAAARIWNRFALVAGVLEESIRLERPGGGGHRGTRSHT